MVLFRPQRGGLDKAMQEVISVTSRADINARYNVQVTEVTPYVYDERIKWDTYIVTGEYPDGTTGVIGFTNGALE